MISLKFSGRRDSARRASADGVERLGDFCIRDHICGVESSHVADFHAADHLVRIRRAGGAFFSVITSHRQRGIRDRPGQAADMVEPKRRRGNTPYRGNRVVSRLQSDDAASARGMAHQATRVAAPIAAGKNPAATPAPEPDDEPPGDHVRYSTDCVWFRKKKIESGAAHLEFMRRRFSEGNDPAGTLERRDRMASCAAILSKSRRE